MRMDSIAEYLGSHLQTDPIHVLVLSETWHHKTEKEIKMTWICRHKQIHKQYMIYTDRTAVQESDKTRGNGTMMFLHRSLRPFVKNILRVPGRGIALKLGKNQIQNIVIAGVYKEHQMNKASELELLKSFEDFWVDADMKIIGGDFNVTLNPSQDRMCHSDASKYLDTTPEHRILSKLTSQYGVDPMMDAWRLTHPNDKQYTYTDTHIQSRVDMILCNRKALNYVYDTSIDSSSNIDAMLRHRFVTMRTKLPFETHNIDPKKIE